MSTQFDAIVQAVIHDWPACGWSGQLEAAIKQLYLSELVYPATWSSDRCEEFAESHAGDDAILLTSSLDDLIDAVTDRYVHDHGVLPHRDDLALLLSAARQDVLDELELRFAADLPAEIAALTAHGVGRADGSLTACGPAQRRQGSALRPSRPRGR